MLRTLTVTVLAGIFVTIATSSVAIATTYKRAILTWDGYWGVGNDSLDDDPGFNVVGGTLVMKDFSYDTEMTKSNFESFSFKYNTPWPPPADAPKEFTATASDIDRFSAFVTMQEPLSLTGGDSGGAFITWKTPTGSTVDTMFALNFFDDPPGVGNWFVQDKYGHIASGYDASGFLAPVPIPAALPLLGSAVGLFGLIGMRKQRLAV